MKRSSWISRSKDVTKALSVSGRPVPLEILDSIAVIFINPLKGEPTLPFLKRTNAILVAVYLQGFASIMGIPAIPAALILYASASFKEGLMLFAVLFTMKKTTLSMSLSLNG